MARLIPDMLPSEIENPGERRVAEALVEQLPKRVEVVHSFNWLGEDRRGRLTEGECDFVLIDPRNGLLFVEVKGGGIEYDPDARVWRRTLPDGRARKLRRNPFDQASRSMHEIVGMVARELGADANQPPFTRAYAVAFPDSRCSGVLPANMRPDLLLDAEKCRDMAASVQRVFDSFRRPSHRALSNQETEAARRVLFPEFRILPVLWRRVQDQEEQLARLTAEQQRLLVFLAHRPLAAIQGVAGSGKTLLALAKAQEAARRGMRALLLCYNKPLKEWLRRAAPQDLGGALTVENYHGLAFALCAKAGVEFRPQAAEDEYAFWQDKAPELLVEACDRLGPEHQFDAVVVDEGQDFRDLWWTSLESVFRAPARKGCYYVFYDPDQNLYVEEPDYPAELGEPFALLGNCRNTLRIAEHCAALVGRPARVLDGVPAGDDPEVLLARDLPSAFRLAGKRVREWVMPDAGGLDPSQVAVLAPSRAKDAWPAAFQNVPACAELGPWREGEGVLLATWARFKGLEADAVIVVDNLDDTAENTRANRYVARSRAKHLLTVIQVKEGEGRA